jgi:hypothetical protein
MSNAPASRTCADDTVGGSWDLSAASRRSEQVSRIILSALVGTLLAVPAAAGSSGGERTLALVSTGTKVELVQLDPIALTPAAGVPRVRLGVQDVPWALSPDGSLLAIGSLRSTSLAFVDLVTMRAIGRISTGFQVALAWPEPRRLLLFEYGAHRLRATLIDPVERRVLSRRTLGTLARARDVFAAATTTDGLALLLAPGSRVATATLLLLGADGSARRVALPRISAGRMKTRRSDGRTFFRSRSPGLAVDGEGGRAYVITAGSRVAVVNLTTLGVSYRELRGAGAGASRSSHATTTGGGSVLSSGTVRQAHWLGEGVIASAGWNRSAIATPRGPEQRERPAGLRLLDTQRGSSQTLLEGARWFHATGDLVLARTTPEQGAGTSVAGFARDGTERFRLQLDMHLLGIQSAGPYLYLGLGTTYRPHSVAVIDTRTGELVGKPTAPGWTMLVSATQPQLCACYTGTTVD